eukprot:TRINITY_DN2902_c0_g1_i1.p1 TRINITY_DN2902_c0_g1~~TRINITY_DN2902_c0_g1_i1.p1  ORF type:complete len:371 (-),score=48.42 TRINITY_DN2902_c0_g1_i1:111-1223(-)
MTLLKRNHILVLCVVVFVVWAFLQADLWTAGVNTIQSSTYYEDPGNVNYSDAAVHRNRLKYRNPCVPLEDSRLACLPSYILLGAMKAGTTFLDHYMQEHPSFAGHKAKELFFFSHHHKKGVGWYSSLFTNVTIGDGKIIGEGTPVYLGWPLAPERMYLTIPNAKLMVVLRDPVERAYSQYHHSVKWLIRRKWEPLTLTFEELVEEEVQLYKHCKMYEGLPMPNFVPFDFNEWNATDKLFYPECWRDCKLCFPLMNSIHGADNPAFGLLAKSLYYYQIERYRQYFPADQLLYLSYETLAEEPGSIMIQIEDFLEIPHHNYAGFSKQNANSYPDMLPETRRKLREFFLPHSQKLPDLLRVKWDWMVSYDKID